MRRKLTVLITTLVVALWLGRGAPAWTQEAAPYPVWWSPELELESLLAIDDRLAREFPIDQWRIAARYSDREKTVIDNCVSLTTQINTREFGLVITEYDSSTDYFYSQKTDCDALAMIKGASPAKESYLRDFVFSLEALDYLPALLIGHDTALSQAKSTCELLCQFLLANTKLTTLSRFEDVPLIDIKNGEDFVVWARGRGARLKIIARADFDGDGVDDMLIKRKILTTRSQRSDLLLLTRESSDSVMRVLNPPAGCIYSDGTDACLQTE